MRRLILNALVVLALSMPVLAGDIPGSGKQDPPPQPSPSPTNTASATESTTTLSTILLTIYLTIKGA